MTEAVLHQGSGARMDALADHCAALVLTSPPYFAPEHETLLREGLPPGADLESLASELLRYAWTLRPVFAEADRVLAPGGRMILQTRDVRLRHRLAPVEGAHRALVESLGLGLYTRHLWRPRHTTLARRRSTAALGATLGPMPFDPEVFLVFWKPGPERPGAPLDEDLALLQSDVCVTVPGRLPAGHRFQAPLPMLRALVRAHSRPDDLVVDPFAGGGTVLRVARELGRTAWGFEIDPDALALARRNLGLPEDPVR